MAPIISTQGTSTTTTKFAGDDSSYNENRIGTRLTYKLFTKLNTLAEFNVGKTNYETNVIGDSEFFESLFGVQFKETAKTTGIFKVGYRIRSYEEDQFDPFKGVVLSYESKTQLTASTLLSVLLRRSQEEALVVNTNDIRNFYELNSIYFTISRQLTSKINASFTNYYQFLDFPNVRSDTSTANDSNLEFFTYGFRPAINYKIHKWLFANFSYWYDNRSSDDNSNNTIASGWEKSVATFTIGATF
ncbi:MAG: outer membrane beta-barrel protein [Candidatus Brocadiaceae bacterium]